MGKHAIMIIKNKNNKYLQYYDNRWNGFLFPNCKLDENNIEVVKSDISNKLEIDKNNIKVNFIVEKKHEKFSESDKIIKKYHHYFYIVKIDNLTDTDFKKNNVQYKWFSINELENDERIMKINSDIVSYVKEIVNN